MIEAQDDEGESRVEHAESPERKDSEPGELEAASESAQASLANLQEGRRVSMLGAELPGRVLVAMAIFLVAFMIVWMFMWAALGGLGLALGWTVAAAAGAAAVKLYGDRVA